MTKIRSTKTADERKAAAEQLHETIATKVEELTTSDGWAQFLSLATGFHAYSLNNLLLIAAQRPDATRVAGFRQWQARGRQVRKGERAIKIFGYATKKLELADTPSDDDTNDEAPRRTYFPILSVFDVSQTDPIEGVEEVPELAPRLQGDDVAGIYAAVADWLTSDGWTITRARLAGEDGNTSITGTKQMQIEEQLSPAHAALTILHEAAHAHLHAGITDYQRHRGIYETEAESTAYVVAGVLGLDASANSIGYIAGWTRGETDTVRACASRVLTAVRTILDGITEPVDKR